MSDEHILARPTRRFRRRSVMFNIPIVPRQTKLDRLKLSLPVITPDASIPADYLFSRLQKNARGYQKAPILVTRRGAAKVNVEFRPTDWLFALTVRLTLSDGRWNGAGHLELNAMRFFAHLAAKRDLSVDVSFDSDDLFKPSRSRTEHTETLDGKDNFIEEANLYDASEQNWPDLCHSYIRVITDLFSDVFGPRGSLDRRRKPLLVLPPFEAWVWREIEVCHEYSETDAVSIAAQFREVTLSHARDHKTKSFGKPRSLQENVKAADMYSTTLELTKGIDLVFYAKSLKRLRFEVRYRHNILKSCRIVQGQLPRSSDAIRTVLLAVSEDATRRLNKALTEVLATIKGSGPNLSIISLALAHVASACPDDSALLQRLISVFIESQSVSALPENRGVIDVLVEKGVLVKSKFKVRSPQPNFVLHERFRASFVELRTALNKMGTKASDN